MAGSASVRDLSPAGVHQLKLVGDVHKSVGCVNLPPLRGCRKMAGMLKVGTLAAADVEGVVRETVRTCFSVDLRDDEALGGHST